MQGHRGNLTLVTARPAYATRQRLDSTGSSSGGSKADMTTAQAAPATAGLNRGWDWICAGACLSLAGVDDSALLLLLLLVCASDEAVLLCGSRRSSSAAITPKAAVVHANCMAEHNPQSVKGQDGVRGRRVSELEPAWRSGNPTLTDGSAAPLQSVLMRSAAVEDNRMVGPALGSLQKTQYAGAIGVWCSSY